MAAVRTGLRPLTSGLNLSTRGIQAAPVKKTLSAHSLPASNDSVSGANPALSVIEIESKLRDKVKSRVVDLQRAFQSYDINQALSVTKGEFRRVLEAYCIGLTTDQFDAILHKIDCNPNGTVKYCDFLDKFGGGFKPGAAPSKIAKEKQWVSGTQRYLDAQSPKQINTDMVEKMLREKILKNPKGILKAMRLYDYNRDSHIQRHELRKVLENHCFKMTDQQFDKLYQRYDFHHRGVINYKEFLTRLGVQGLEKDKPDPGTAKDAQTAMNWNVQQPEPKAPPIFSSKNQDPDDSKVAGMTIHEVEMEFRKKMIENYADLKRIFIVFDVHLDGFIALEDLRSVVNNFVFPMSDQLFAQLMDRLKIKASGRVSWEFFLEKFQDPQSHGNGQTVPIGKNHKFFPIRGVNEKKDIKDIIKQLHDHVKNHYSSFKKAFLEIDKNRDGKITKKELKKVLDLFKFPVTSDQFKELMILLDPQHTNSISYHRFLDLFEERETNEGHKWLKSCHKFNDNPKPAILAWNTVEDLLREKIVASWKDIASSIVNCDSQNTLTIYPKELRKIVERFTIPIADEHYEDMLGRIVDRSDQGKVNYVEFFTKLGVTVSPGDLEGLSTHIQQDHDYEEARHAADQGMRHEEMDTQAYSRTFGMSADEVIIRLRDKFSQRDTEIRKAFKKYDKKGKGKVSKRVFREVLEQFGFYVNDELFKEICAKLSFTNGLMNYVDFVANFDDSRHMGPSSDIIRTNNHRVNPIRGDEYGITAQEVGEKLKKKIKENFENLRGAFYKFDDDHNGILTKGNFRRMLDSFMLIMSDVEFQKFCQMAGLDKRSRITYHDFLNVFEEKDSIEEGHKWLKSTHRFNETKPVQLMSAEDVHKVLAEKAHRQWVDLAKAFRTMDSKSNGRISKRELRETLYNFMLPMSKEEFNRLWDRYDEGNKGFVSHRDFLKHLTGDQFAPGDAQGTSKTITVNSYLRLAEQHEDQQLRQEQITVNQANRAVVFTSEQLITVLRDRIRDTYEDFQTAFKKYEKKKRGYVTSNDIQKMLVDFHLFVDDDQYYDLLEKIGLSGNVKHMTYEMFLKAFEEGRKDNYKPKSEDVYYPQIENGELSPDKAMGKMKKKVLKNIDMITKAMQALDKSGAGNVPLPVFRRLLDNFCFKMTDAQFKQYMTSVPTNADGTVKGSQFVETHDTKNADPEAWIDKLRRQQREDSPHIMTMDEVQDTMKEQIRNKYHALSKGFADNDYAKIGVVAQNDFKEILFRFTIKLTDEQFDKFWESLPVNEFGNLDYEDFLKKFCPELRKEKDAFRPGTSAGVPGTASGYRRLQTSDSMRDSLVSRGRTMARPFTPMVNAEGAENKLKEKIHRHWKDIQRQCRALDDGSGTISQADFQYICERHNLGLTDDDIQKLLTKYDLKNNNSFSYTEFLKHFVLNMKNQSDNESQMGTKTKLMATRTSQLSPGTRSSQYDGAIHRIQACVQTNWKEMRREFRNCDPKGTGSVNANEFRQVLRNQNANLSEDEFFHLITFHDKTRNGRVSYNDFIKAVLQL